MPSLVSAAGFSGKMFRFETAGESHGECLVATLTGLPAGIPISLEAVNRELWRRQQGYGRGGRMKIETDRAEIVAGVRHSHTIGSPIAILIRNRDWQNWTEALPGGRRRRRRRQAQARHPPAARPCRPGRRHQVQFSRCPLHSGARQRPRNRGARGGGRHGQGAARRIRHRGAEPRDRRGRRAPGTRRPRGKSWWRSAEKQEVLLGCVDAGRGSAHERSGGRGLPHRRYRGRRLRSGGARRARRAWARTSPGIRAWMAAWRRPSSPCRR